MKLKRFAALFLIVAAIGSFACCSKEEPEKPKKDLSGLKDEQVIETLLAEYRGLSFSAATYEAEVTCSYSGNEATVSVKASVLDSAFSLSSVTNVGETSQTSEMVFVDGVLYLSLMGEKTKVSLGSDAAGERMEQQLPFVLKDLSVFEKQDLLRGEDGSYVVVLSQASEELLSVLDLQSVLPSDASSEENSDAEEDSEAEEDGETSVESVSAEITRVKDPYLSLSFGSDGALQKISLGLVAVVSDDGADADMRLEVVYRILTTDRAEISVKAPADAAEYESLAGNTTDDAGADASSGSGSEGGGETTDTEN